MKNVYLNLILEEVLPRLDKRARFRLLFVLREFSPCLFLSQSKCSDNASDVLEIKI